MISSSQKFAISGKVIEHVLMQVTFCLGMYITNYQCKTYLFTMTKLHYTNVGCNIFGLQAVYGFTPCGLPVGQ